MKRWFGGEAARRGRPRRSDPARGGSARRASVVVAAAAAVPVLAAALLAPAGRRRAADRGPRLRPRRRPRAVGRLRLRARAGPRPPLDPRATTTPARAAPGAGPAHPGTAQEAGSAKVCSAARAPRRPRPRGPTCCPAAATGPPRARADGLSFIDATTGRRRYRLYAPVRVTGGSSTCLRGRALNDRRDRSYRGVLEAAPGRRRVPVVNDVALRHYLYGVVPAEMPSTWPARGAGGPGRRGALLRARSLRPAETVGRPARPERPGLRRRPGGAAATPAAVRRTDPLAALQRGDSRGAAYFSSSSGGPHGRGRGGLPGRVRAAARPVQRVLDPFDRLSPHHDWSVRSSADRGGAPAARRRARRRPGVAAGRGPRADGPGAHRARDGHGGRRRRPGGDDPGPARAAVGLVHRQGEPAAANRALSRRRGISSAS